MATPDALTPVAAQLVVFGLTGDLAQRKLLPALYQLMADGQLPGHTHIIGVTRRDISAAEVLAGLRDNPAYDSGIVKQLEQRVSMFKMDLAERDSYDQLKRFLDEDEQATGQCFNRLFYLSMPPQVFDPVIDFLGVSGLSEGCSHHAENHHAGESRLLIEKPFGFDLASAEALVKRVAAQFNQEQIYRIDHYLAKEASQNILAFRKHNPLFQAAWDARSIDRLTVTTAESIGIAGRAVFYDQTGALRDVLQNHLMQLLALVAMELPEELTADAVHAAKLRLLEAIPAIAPNEVASRTRRGQYQGYREEAKSPTSVTETFAAVRLEIDNNRWRGVPVILQTGKALSARVTEVTVHFKGNELVMRIEPDQGICLNLLAKKPGLGHELQPVEMDFRYARSFGDRHPDAYERVLADALRGDRTLFATDAEALESWRILNAVVGEWAKGGEGLMEYEPKTDIRKLSF